MLVSMTTAFEFLATTSQAAGTRQRGLALCVLAATGVGKIAADAARTGKTHRTLRILVRTLRDAASSGFPFGLPFGLQAKAPRRRRRGPLSATRARRRSDYVALLAPTEPATPRISTR